MHKIGLVPNVLDIVMFADVLTATAGELKLNEFSIGSDICLSGTWTCLQGSINKKKYGGRLCTH